MNSIQPGVVMLTPDRQIDRRILLEADTLEAAGWRVTIIGMPLDTDAVDDPRVVRVGTTAGAVSRENRVADAYRLIRRHLPMNGRLMRLMKRLAWRYVVDQESFYMRLFLDTASAYPADVYVAHDLPMLPVASHLAGRSGARVVYDSHELYCEQEFSATERQRWSQIESRYIHDCQAVITVNPSIAAEIEKRYGLSDVHVIYNAERTSTAPPRSRYFHDVFALEPGTKVLLLQGGLSAGRNLEHLVEAMAQVGNQDVVLVLLGDGALRDTLSARARSAGSGARVRFHPAVAQHELLALTAAADAGVIPYQATCLNNYYCTPNKLFEFIAAGTPVLSSDLPEITRIVRGHDIGLVGRMDSPAHIAALIDEFFAPTGRQVEWTRNVASARTRICWEEEEKKLVSIYEALK